MNRGLSQFRVLQRHVGLSGSIGVAVLALALGGYFMAVVPARHQAQALAQDLSKARRTMPAEIAAPTEVSGIDAFYKQFADISTLPNWLDALQELAAELKLEQIEGEYKLGVDDDGKILKYEIQLPVRGNYLNVRRFMNEAVKSIPNLGLRDVDLRRKAIEDGTVEARLTFVLFLLGK